MGAHAAVFMVHEGTTGAFEPCMPERLRAAGAEKRVVSLRVLAAPLFDGGVKGQVFGNRAIVTGFELMDRGAFFE
jgi:hypothetical protein